MKVLTDLEIEKAAMLKAYRSAIRLKYSLVADREISKALPEVEKRIDAALQSGNPLELNPGQAFEENFVENSR